MQYQQGLERLVAVIQQLSLSRTLDAVTRVVGEAARDLTGADGATFVLRDGDLCFYADENAIGPLWKGRRFPMSLCVSGWVMRHRKSLVLEDVFADERVPTDAYRPTFVKSLAMVPIRTAAPLGAIGNYWARPYQPSPDQLKLLQALADTTAVAMENVYVYAELEERVRRRTAELEAANRQLAAEVVVRRQAEEEIRHRSLTDELTGLHNRRGFYYLGEQERKIASRLHQPCTMLFIDLDGLKQANDRHGHEVGDAMLAAAGRVLSLTFRESDVVARLGGDEFAVLAVGDAESPEAMLNRLHEAVEEFNLQSRHSFRLSMSVGMAQLGPGEGDTLERALAKADQAMYAVKRAKKQGRVSVIS